MESNVNKDQDPPRGGSWIRKPDGSLEQREGTKPAADTTATQPKPATPAAPASAMGDEE